jgi:exopolyphosphatase/guanosine-5'-triphosphate,3'-diphosphate pyrophosphatase
VAGHRTAVIDMGSNSFRLVVFTAADGWWKRTDEIYLAVRIGEGLEATGELGTKPMKRGLEAAEVFAHFCTASGIESEDIKAVATSAIRDAGNQQVFLDTLKDRTGL